jgi:hypothetical protein
VYKTKWKHLYFPIKCTTEKEEKATTAKDSIGGKSEEYTQVIMKVADLFKNRNEQRVIIDNTATYFSGES